MKISKLFHWLYATLMFLPLVFFIPSCLYYGFNEHATNTETTTINYKYQSNEVNSFDDLIDGNIYHFELNNENTFVDFAGLLINGEINFTYTDVVEGDETYFHVTNGQYFYIYIEDNGDDTYSKTYYVCDNELNIITYYNFDYYDINCDFVFLNGDISSYLISNFSYTDYNVIESVVINTDESITGQVSRAWDSVWNLPLFSWTHTSFVAEPFTYITGLFGMSADNPFNYVVTYFVSISVCWLVFDFLMYVPNLAHRWLDKGALD